MTNADRIRAMSDEELAILLYSVDFQNSVFGGSVLWDNASGCLEWLRQPAEGDDK